MAADFCKLVGAPHLLAYLGLPEDAAPEDARGKLKSRRKFMQGMQGNPKHKREALFLIRSYKALLGVLDDLPTYRADAARRAESEHLPVLEMTMRGVLASGGLTPEQEEYLKRNALDLGVTESTFYTILHQLAEELGIKTSDGIPAPKAPPGADAPIDLYQLLGISPNATSDDIRIAHELRSGEVQSEDTDGEVQQKRIEIAGKVLSNEAARRHYDLTAARTGPPARAREFRPDHASTAPPVRERDTEPRPAAASSGSPTSRLEILGEPVRSLRLGFSTPTTTITIRNGGFGAMGGHVTTDSSWMAVDPVRLVPDEIEQDITVVIDSAAVPAGVEAGAVTIETDRGERARVTFALQRGPTGWEVVGLLVASAALIVLVGGLVWSLSAAP